MEKHQVEFEQHHPQVGWCEHDPAVILGTVTTCISETLRKLEAGGSFSRADVAAVGITNQRETTVVWDRRTGTPLYNALVWLDSRAADTVARFAEESEQGKDRFREVCGLPLMPCFSGMKLRWLLDNVPAVAEGAAAGTALFGTVETWLIWNLSGGVEGGVHVSDVSNASRTMLMELASCSWHAPTCEALGIPLSMLPRIVSNAEVYCRISEGVLAGVAIAAAIGDQQSATVIIIIALFNFIIINYNTVSARALLGPQSKAYRNEAGWCAAGPGVLRGRVCEECEPTRTARLLAPILFCLHL